MTTADGPHGDEGAGPPPSPAAAAPNWRVVIAADAALGVGVVVVGVVLAVTWQPVVGSGLASLGFVYVALGLRRATRWRAWRRAVGLDGGGRDTLQS
jgi:hypothetical protein